MHLDSKHADLRFDTNATVYYLTDPIVLPSSEYEWLVSVPHATIPLSHWVVGEENNLLHLEFSSETKHISLPFGNRSIDEIVTLLNDEQLADGYTAAYDEGTNRLVFSSETPAASIEVGPLTTCTKLLGLTIGQSGVESLTGERSVNLAGTSSIFFRSNLSTRNRDPVSKAMSDILAKVHVSRNFNEIEYYSSSQKFPISDRVITVVALYLTDDAQNQLDLHGSDYSITLEFTMRPKEAVRHTMDYRLSGVMNNNVLASAPIRDAPSAEPTNAKADTRGLEPSKR